MYFINSAAGQVAHGFVTATTEATDSQCRDHRSVAAGPHRRGTHRIHQPGGSQSPVRLIPMRLLTTKRFEKDLKRGRKRGKDLDKLWSVVERLLSRSASRPTTSEASVDRGLVSLLGMSHRTGLAVGLGPGGRCSHPGSDWNPYRFVRLIWRSSAAGARVPLRSTPPHAHRPYGQSGGPGAKHSAYALSDTSGRVSLHRLARARASPAGTP